MIGAESDALAAVVDSDAGRRETFLRLISEYRAALRRLAAVYVNDSRDREDLVQEIAVALWQAIPKFRGEASERTWLYRIAHNTAITGSAKLRRRGRTESTVDELPDPPAATMHGDERLIDSQKREWLMRAIRELTPVDRQIVTLHLEELSYREIQEITGMTEGAVATRLTRIRDRLAEQIRRREVELRGTETPRTIVLPISGAASLLPPRVRKRKKRVRKC
jgi:RNA polymerase sigma-70 factor (ECF subfamily)